ncbi:hypothetical protein [Listeria rocourtiae]|uniref:Uncharacterized protein n=1 Tax=Listeria rocourtiae TaxID=647910 RepID=A0A4R6ZN84_9LIST|nr:hypothetical protein [Listeria rocourtiae]EUJ42563.1 hypothetical protein PROCOU_16959 [Listeria rocourtiae FSL F6-920]TDR53933.1 hypothetical protein DFP96_10327 [Listeria rocourtiae]
MKVINAFFTFLTSWIVSIIIFGAIILACGFIASIFTSQFPVDTLMWITIIISFAFAGYTVFRDGDEE